MKDELHLRGCDRDVFAYLYQFGQGGHSILIFVPDVEHATGHDMESIEESLDSLRRDLYFIPGDDSDATMVFILNGEVIGSPQVKFAKWVYERINQY